MALKLALTEWLQEFAVPHQYSSKLNWFAFSLLVVKDLTVKCQGLGFLGLWESRKDGALALDVLVSPSSVRIYMLPQLD